MKKFAMLSLFLLVASLFSSLAFAQQNQVTIQPSIPADNDDLSCFLNNAQPTNVQYLWRRNPGPNNQGAVIFNSNQNGMIVPLSNTLTSPGDVFSCEVVVVTQAGGVQIVNSRGVATVQIIHDLGAARVTIEPGTPTDADDLWCVVDGSRQTSYQYRWTVNRGAPINGRDAAGNIIPLSASQSTVGDVVGCTVFFISGGSVINIGSASVTIGRGVTPPQNQPPVVTIVQPQRNQNILVNTPITITATAVDPEGNPIVSWRVSPGEGSELTPSDMRNQVQATVMYQTVGTKTITVTATDSLGATSAPARVDINVNAVPRGLIIQNIGTFEDSFFSRVRSAFLRGEDMFVKFKVVDSANNPVIGAQIAGYVESTRTGTRMQLQQFNGNFGSREGIGLSLQRVVNGESAQVCLPFIGCIGGPNGNYYYVVPQISLADGVLGENIVVINAVSGQENAAGQTRITINNNPPVIGARDFLGRLRPIPNQRVLVGAEARINLNDFVEDVEDVDAALVWSGAGRYVQLLPGNVLRVVGNGVGVETVSLAVRDTDGGVDTREVTITVTPSERLIPPVAAIRVDRTVGEINEPFTFTSVSSDSDGTIVSHKWDFGDGDQAVGLVAVHRFARPGTYTITLRVEDNDGLSGTATVAVEVVLERIPSVDEPSRGEFAGRIVDVHSFKVGSVKLFPYREKYAPGDFVNLFLKLENEGIVEEQLQIKAVWSGLNVPLMSGSQWVDAGDMRINNHFSFVIPKNTRSGVYLGRVEVSNQEGDRVVEFVTLRVG